ncbi:hypothetical protein OIU78_026355 [Salix suchowensis]|nr:hypothetical protein OIU78_026355 [Salix suchowensis]
MNITVLSNGRIHMRQPLLRSYVHFSELTRLQQMDPTKIDNENHHKCGILSPYFLRGISSLITLSFNMLYSKLVTMLN